MKDKKITKALVLEVLEKINEKDFLRIIESVESACAADEKARKDFYGFNPTTGTYYNYRRAEEQLKVCAAIKTGKLKEFFDLFTERVRTFNGLSVIRKDKAEIKKESL